MKRSVLSSKRGVALLMALGILVIMSILGMSFAASMRLGEKGSKAFLWNIQAKYMAEGGMKRAIADLKYNTTQGAATKFLDDHNEDWYFSDGPGTDIEAANNSSFKYVFNNKLATIEFIDGFLHEYADVNISKKIIGTVKLKIIDTGSLVNVNDSNNPDLVNILDNLGLSSTQAADLVTYIQSNTFLTKKDITLVTGIDSADYDTIKDYITVTSYKDPNNNSKAPINVNAASSQVLEAIFQPLVGAKANALASAVITSGPFNSWADFNNFMKGGGIPPAGLTDAEADSVIASVNPNQDGVDDTKFIFNSGGTYDIECLATIRADRGAVGVPAGETDDVVLAEKRIKTTVQVFNMWNQTTKDQFKQPDYGEVGGDAGDEWDGEIRRVTWMDSCPVNSGENWNQPGDSYTYQTIEDSLKLGFWDNFEEDTTFSNYEWKERKSGSETSSIVGGKLSMPQFGEWILGAPLSGDWTAKWWFRPMSGTIYCHENNDGSGDWPNAGLIDETTDPWEFTANWVGTFIFRWVWEDDSMALIYLATHITESGTILYDVAERQKLQYSLRDELYGGIVPTTIPTYPADKIYKVLQKVNADDTEDVTLSIIVGSDTTSASSFSHSESNVSRDQGWGLVKMWNGSDDGCEWDNIRIISEGGSYISPSVVNLSSNVEWGTIFTTVTIPSTANGDNEKVGLSTKSVGAWNYIGTSADTGAGPPWGCSITGAINEPDSTNIQYKIDFTTSDPDFSETPVLEDVWITYLPTAKVLYWREGE